MTRKKGISFLVGFLLICATFPSIIPTAQAQDPQQLWALIICGSEEPGSFPEDAGYMYHVLNDHYDFDGIYYLHVYTDRPGVDALSTKANVRSAITNWLDDHSSENDIIFIYFTSHGGGYHSGNNALEGGRYDASGDEGNEIHETTLGVDLDGDGNMDDWVGIDECMQVQDGLYWDDELASDLDTLSYAKLIFVRQGCLEGDEGCFGGGLIDDISAANRIIMTATDETHHSYGPPTDAYSCWSEHFIDALHGEKTHWDNGVVHDGTPVDADGNNDGHVSMWEAFEYAWNNDYARLQGWETPWIDDNGNGLPTYREERDELDGYPYIDSPSHNDGLFAYETYFGFEEIRSPDINGDHKVRVDDVLAIALAFGSEPGHPRWNPAADLNHDNKIRVNDVLAAALMWPKSYSSNSSGSPSHSPEVSVCPKETTIGKHQPFTVNVTVANVTDLGAYEFHLYYNATAFNCTGLDLPSGHFLEPVVDPNNIFNVSLVYDNEYNSTHGFVCVALSLMGEEPFKNGSGTLVTVDFNATAIGNYDLKFKETMLVNSSCQAMPVTVVDGSVTVLPSLTVLAQDQNATALTTGDVYIDDEWSGFTGSTFLVNASLHEVRVNDFWEINNTGYRYGFMNWTDGSVDNPRNITVLDDTTITANFYKKWCPGDVNGDSKVRVDDILFVANRFGSNRGDSDWDSRADVIYDGKIRVDDVLEVASNFGNNY